MQTGFASKLRRTLRRDILSGQHRPGQALPSTKELLKTCGFSSNKVDRPTDHALRRAMTSLADEGLLVRVRGRGTFVADTLPKNTTTGMITIVNAIQPGQSNYVASMEAIRGIGEQCHNLGVETHLHQVVDLNREYDPQSLMAVLKDTSGVLLIPAQQGTALDVIPSWLHLESIPCVTLLTTYAPPNSSTYLPDVNFDRSQGAYMVTKHATSIGCKRIAYIGEQNINELRLAGFMRAVMECGLDFPVNYIVSCDKTRQGIRDAVAKLLKAKQRPEVICCSTGRIAIGVIHVLVESGIKVPQDVMVVAALSGAASDSNTPISLTRALAPATECGSAAMKLLYDLMADKPASQRPVMIEQKLEIGESCPAQRP